MGSPLHIRFLNLMIAIREMSSFAAMSADEEELLRDLIIRWHKDEEIPVGRIMRDLAGVSETTAYRRLIALRDKGFVHLRIDATDKRVKIVEPTPLAMDYAERIHKALRGLTGKAELA